MDRGMISGFVVDRGVVDGGVVDGFVVDGSVVDRGVVDRGMVDRGVPVAVAVATAARVGVDEGHEGQHCRGVLKLDKVGMELGLTLLYLVRYFSPSDVNSP